MKIQPDKATDKKVWGIVAEHKNVFMSVSQARDTFYPGAVSGVHLGRLAE